MKLGGLLMGCLRLKCHKCGNFKDHLADLLIGEDIPKPKHSVDLFVCKLSEKLVCSICCRSSKEEGDCTLKDCSHYS